MRAAVVVPLAAALSFAVAGNSQTPLFTIFGSFALMVLADFPGNRPDPRAGLRGAGHQRRGPDHAGHAGVAARVAVGGLMFVLGVAVMFAGVLSETIAAGQRPRC